MTDRHQILQAVRAGLMTPAEARRRLTPGRPARDGAEHRATASRREPVAIVGVSGRFGRADSPDELWSLVEEARDAVEEVPPSRWDARSRFAAEAAPGRITSRWGGFLSSVDLFDPTFFNISGRDAEAMDPQQRLFLEAAWTALEEAGYAGSARAVRRCGVYVGVPPSDYLASDERDGSQADARTMMGNDNSILAARISYLLDLRGPNLSLNTACSSSLVALDLACRTLCDGEIDLAVVGGACLFLGPGFYLSASAGGMLSPTGACRAFDAQADGFVPGEGVGALVLCRLSDAVDAGDQIRGVVLATGTNQDGRTNGLTAPSARAQYDLEREVLARAGVVARDIELVEAHGTGTALGDPIEFEALTRAFRDDTADRQFCALGSVKTNVGHTGQAAGLAGVVKVLGAFEHRTIPPTRNFTAPNPAIDLERSPFYVPTEPRQWAASDHPRRAAVSSFGYSGTNAHAILQEAPERAPRPVLPERHVVVLTARTPEALVALRRETARALLGRAQDTTLHDVAWTLSQGRRRWPHRWACAVVDLPELVERLQSDEAADDPDVRAFIDQGIEPPPHEGCPGVIVRLPTHPFDRQRYWHPPVEPSRTVQGRTDGTPGWQPDGIDVHGVDRTDDVVEMGITTGGEWVTEHCVGDAHVMAAAGTVTVMIAAARVAGARGSLGVRDLRWIAPVDPDRTLNVRVRSGHDGWRTELRHAGDAAPCSTGRVTTDAAPCSTGRVTTDAPDHRTALPSGPEESLDPAEVYRACSAAGLRHGPGYRILTSAEGGPGWVRAEYRVEGDPANRDALVLDGALQTATLLTLRAGGEIGFPVALELVEVPAGGLPASGWFVASSTPDGAIDIGIRSGECVIGALRGLRTSAPRRPEGQPRAGILERRWRPAPKASEAAPPRLLLGADGATAPDGTPVADLGAALRGEHVTVAVEADPLTAAGPVRAVIDAMVAHPTRARLTFAVPRSARGESSALALTAWLTSLAHETSGVEASVALTAWGERPDTDRGPGPFRRVDATVHELGLEAADPTPDAPWRPAAGFYLVSGGTGHVGRAIARALVRVGGRVALLARTAPDAVSLAEIGADTPVLQADVTDAAQVRVALTALRARGSISGVVHCAGEAYVGRWDRQDEDAVDRMLRTKILGARHLDDATRDDDLDLFCLTSSVLAVAGLPGHTAYAYANGALDGHALERARSSRPGRSLSIAWGPWDGGMADGAVIGGAPRAFDPDSGGAAFLDVLATSATCAVVLADQADAVALAAGAGARPDEHRGTAVEVTPSAAGSTTDDLDLLTLLVAEELRIPLHRITADSLLTDLGVESFMVVDLVRRLDETYLDVPKTLFFECRTVGELASALARRGRRAPAAAPDPRPGPDAPPTGSAAVAEPATLALPTATSDVAVIGLAGRFPGADDLEEFWANLLGGKDSVEEVPDDRWSLDGFYQPDRTPLRSYSKWGGFLRGIDLFDASFFRIAPKEAAMIDPQERLLLQTAWHTVESAGLTPASLPDSTGVYVGVMYGEYQLLGATQDGRLAGSSFASIANRLSYTFDVRGPSMAVDTMCSSSLSALHLALAALRRGECDAALVGGVNLSLHPRKYLQLSLARFASTDGRCRSFGAGGDGYVPGEGVGALLLKPLDAALRDGDPVRAVLRGSAVNHGGRANGYTVPDPVAQGRVVRAALDDGGTTAVGIGYVEAHGTGTALGDPIEVRGLASVFSEERDVPVGSVKSNIGHLESAAGVAALAKVILQLENDMLVPSLHALPPNGDLHLEEAGLTVVTAARPWPPGRPRVALVSSFGAGGSNASVVVARAPEPERVVAPETGGTHLLLVTGADPERLRSHADSLAGWMSRHRADHRDDAVAQVRASVASLLGVMDSDVADDASWDELGLDVRGRTELGALLERWLGDRAPVASVATLADLLRALPAPAATGIALADVAHTLRVGRVHHAHRMACIASSWDEAIERLRAVAGGAAPPGTWVGRAASTPESQASPDDARPAGPEEAARRWVEGHDVEWPIDTGRRIPLPGYPFRPDRTWLDGATPLTVAGPGAGERAPSSVDDAAQGSAPVAEVASVAGEAAEDEVRLLVVEWVTRIAADIIGLEPERLDPAQPLGDAGFESMTLRDLGAAVGARLGVEVNPAVFYEVEGITGFAARLVHDFPGESRAAVLTATATGSPGARPAEPALRTAVTGTVARPTVARGDVPAPTDDAIAVVGLSARLPLSGHYEEFWDHLWDGDRLVTEVPAHRWDWRSYDPGEASVYRWGCFIADEDAFDPAFFGIDPAEARLIDPQQRLLLEHAWSALEDAGIDPTSLRGTSTGVFAGVQFRDYQHLLHEAGVLDVRTATGNEDSFAVNRISYLLDLHGPSEVVNTACASSLTAVHRAVRSLRSGECDLALSGGVALNLTPYAAMALDGVGVLAGDGRCRPLDASANGYVKGEGVGFLVLKRLDRAIAENDHVHAVIRGTATNHGGRATSMTAPNMRAQADVVAAAVRDAHVDVATLGYVEMHGTGTYVGDPVEVRGLQMAVARLTEEQGSAPTVIRIGSGKGNYGHLEPASGLAGLVKVIGSLQRATIFAMPELDTVNPHIDLAGSPLVIGDRTTEWHASDGHPRRCGVSSFGIGGSNAHVIVEEAPAPDADDATAEVLAFPLSGRTSTALAAQCRNLAAWLGARGGDVPLARVARTLQDGRQVHAHRLVVAARDADDLLLELKAAAGDIGTALRGCVNDLGGELAGDAADWVRGRLGRLSQRLTARTVPLPSYPFERDRLWFCDRSPLRRDAVLPAGVVDGGTRTAALAPAQPAAPAGDVERVRGVVASVLRVAPESLPTDVPFRELGVDSLLSVSVMEALQERVEASLPLSALVDYPTIGALAAMLNGEATTTGEEMPVQIRPAKTSTAIAGPSRPTTPDRATSLVRLAAGKGRPTSFWVPGAVGFAMALGGLSRELGPNYPFYAFQARGADGVSMPQLWPEMLSDYLAAILQTQPSGPYYLGGHSFGGLTAMQLGRRLSALGHEVAHLVMVDTYPPTETVFNSHDASYDDAFMAFYLANVLVDVDQHPERRITRAQLADVPHELRLVTLANLVAERVGGLTTADGAYRYLRGGLVMSEHSAGLYQQATLEPYDCSDVTFFRATDGFVGASSASYWDRVDILGDYDYVSVWRDSITTTFEQIALPEDHLHLLDGACARTVATHVRRCMGEDA